MRFNALWDVFLLFFHGEKKCGASGKTKLKEITTTEDLSLFMTRNKSMQ